MGGGVINKTKMQGGYFMKSQLIIGLGVGQVFMCLMDS